MTANQRLRRARVPNKKEISKLKTELSEKSIIFEIYPKDNAFCLYYLMFSTFLPISTVLVI